VHVRRVLHYLHVFTLHAGETQLGDGGCGVRQQPTFILRITPRFSDHLRAVTGADLVLISVNQFIQCRRVNQSFLL
jgi:hypothetical protein